MAKVSVISPSFIEGFVTECHNRGLMEKEAASLLNGYIDGAMSLSEQNMEKKAAPMPFAKLLTENLKYGGHLFRKLFPKKFISNIPNMATKPLQWGGELANKHGWPGGIVGLLGAGAAYGLPVYAFDKYRQSDAPGADFLRAMTGSGRIFGGSGSDYSIHDIPGYSDNSPASSGSGYTPEAVPTSRDNIFTGPGRGEERELESLGVAIPAAARASASTGGKVKGKFIGSPSEARQVGDWLNEREARQLELDRAISDANKEQNMTLRRGLKRKIDEKRRAVGSVNDKLIAAAGQQGSRLAGAKADVSRQLSDLQDQLRQAERAYNDNLNVTENLEGGNFIERGIAKLMQNKNLPTNYDRRGDRIVELTNQIKKLQEQSDRLNRTQGFSVDFN